MSKGAATVSRRPVRTRLAAAIGAVVGIAAAASAGHATDQTIGPRSRVQVEFIRETGKTPKLLHLESRKGTLTAIDTTGLTLMEDRSLEPLRLSMSEVERIRTSTGRSARRGIVLGLGWGVAGGFAAAVVADMIKGGGAEPRDGIGHAGYVGFLALGTTAGMLVGSNAWAEGWETYDLGRLWQPTTR